ncbi:hypothetical protein DFH28DRAFT_903842 [Melampsora americana]|nr:hypothetical protein DFH28DRAFT_903842 [Melampsora americana]
MDPSDPNISQSDMYEWLCRRDPTNSVHFNPNRHQLATKVREAQPKLFPTPDSNTLTTSLKSQSVASLHSSKFHDQQSESADSLQKECLNIHGKRKRMMASEARQSNKARTIDQKPTIQKPTIQMEKLRPRFVNYLNPVLPIPPSSVIKTVVSSSDEGDVNVNEQRIYQTPSASTMRCSGTPAAISVTKILKKEPKRVTTLSKISQQGISSLNHHARKFIYLEPYQQTRKASAVKEDEASSSITQGYHKDLISLHDVDWFQTKNTVVGKDITPIKADVSKSYSFDNAKKIKSGVDIFQEERLKEDEVSALKEQVNILKETVQHVEKMREDVVTLKDRVHTLERDLKVACENVDVLNDLLAQKNPSNETDELESTGEDCSLDLN